MFKKAPIRKNRGFLPLPLRRFDRFVRRIAAPLLVKRCPRVVWIITFLHVIWTRRPSINVVFVPRFVTVSSVSHCSILG